ncbi:hypothetical protein H8356DRAFT_1378628 [Neocallimastix lanati (nom. inval.)]|nr:hypothetical protein H8356DRAFT_1378628 [Neocallimastix sp. JGI-2020a]
MTSKKVRRRRSQLPISKETPYRSTLRDPRGKAEPTIGGVLAIPEELDTVYRCTEYKTLNKLYTLNNDVSLYPDTYERRKFGVWNKQKRKILTSNKFKNIIESYKKMESFLIGNERNRSHIAEL